MTGPGISLAALFSRQFLLSSIGRAVKAESKNIVFSVESDRFDSLNRLLLVFL